MPTTNQLTQMLLSFEGRMRRRDFWLLTIALIVVGWILTSILGMLFVTPVPVVTDYNTAYWMAWTRMSTAAGISALLLLWPRLAIGVKRCHDRDKSGWWLLIGLIPILGWIWLLIDIGLLDGTPGPNKYGPSPKGLGGEATPGAPAPTAT
jgi:uncharacterized membrane protein YhaH (DUF805 family)